MRPLTSPINLSRCQLSLVTLDYNVVVCGLAFLAAYLLAPYFLRKNLTDKDGHPIPPGPLFRYPFLEKYPERIVHAWARAYGSIYSVWMGNQLFVVLNDPVVVRDLLVVNGANFSSRHPYFMKNQTILEGGAITASSYNDTWCTIYDLFTYRIMCSTNFSRRKHRKIATTMLAPKAIESYTTGLDYEAHMMIRALYHDSKHGTVPVNPAQYAGRYVLK